MPFILLVTCLILRPILGGHDKAVNSLSEESFELALLDRTTKKEEPLFNVSKLAYKDIDIKGENDYSIRIRGRYMGVKTATIRIGDDGGVIATYLVDLASDGLRHINVPDLASGSYRFSICFEDNYEKHLLPRIYINTADSVPIVSKDNYEAGTFSIDYPDGSPFNNLTSEKMQIRGRGNSTWQWDKKPYKIKFDSETSLFGLERAKDWVLLANYGDKSLIRNHLALNLGQLLDNMVFVPHSFLVDVYKNGEYQGVYSLSEQIEAKRGRVETAKSYNRADTGYLLEAGGTAEGHVKNVDYFHSTLVQYVRIKSPDTDLMQKYQVDYIRQYLIDAEDAIINLDKYEDYIDVPSLIDWFILNELSYNIDCTFRRSFYMVKNERDKLYVCSPWDFDLAFGNFWRDPGTYSGWVSIVNEATEGYIKTNWMNYLLEDKNFTDQLEKRWEQVGPSLRQEAMRIINSSVDEIYPSQVENFKLWRIMGKRSGYEPKENVSIDSFDKHITYLTDYIENRYEWMDEAIRDFD